ncbi:MAG: serine/threonine-protein kinase [Ferruginibacter sp.]
MSKVFTITAGLENMGALKTGGQGSVYKGKRIGEIISAVKILPTPLYSESEADKNFIAFQNEVSKLKRVNEEPNANVVSILGSGVTDSGNFPYIEMEYIEGPDLSELLKDPHPPVFTIEEVIKVATHLSNALAHCHMANVKHGDIKSNNVKFNKHTGNYILLDFGLSLLSDEERRTSLRHAGAIEFMAPEQNEGALLFQTDIYSFGIILFELLAGIVPFPLKDTGETSRNKVMVSHLESLPPDLVLLRGEALPVAWQKETRSVEMNVPVWLLNTIYKCLEKDPGKRFKDGTALHKHILNSQMEAIGKGVLTDEPIQHIREENERLKREKQQLQKLLDSKQISFTNSNGHSSFSHPAPSRHNFSTKNIALLILTACTLGLAGYILLNKNSVAAKNDNPIVIDSTQFLQLRTARENLNNGNIPAALAIYNILIPAKIPEALFHSADLALKDQNNNIDCNTAFKYMGEAAKSYAPARRTLGFIYTADKNLLDLNNYRRCAVSRNISEGSALLMEAVLLGDAEAAQILDALNARIRDKKYSAGFSR